MRAQRISWITVLGVVLTTAPAAAQTVTVPAGSSLEVSIPPDVAFVEHYPLANVVSWTFRFRSPSPVTLTHATARFFDAHGNPMLAVIPISPGHFQTITFDPAQPNAVTLGPDGAVVAANTWISVPFPSCYRGDPVKFPCPVDFVTPPFNVVPSSAAVELCFKEFEGAGGTCDDPLRITEIELTEYTVPGGQTYIHPLGEAGVPGQDVVFSGHCHDLGTLHRLAFIGGHFNQRFSYDAGIPPAAGSPVHAAAAGNVAFIQTGCPAGGPCPIGGGNLVVLAHNNGENTWYAHLEEGSNDHLPGGTGMPCTDPAACDVDRGGLLGTIGATGNVSGPHLHFQAETGPTAGGADTTPMYFTNVVFSSLGFSAKRQLDISIPCDVNLGILPPPAPIVPNPGSPPGQVSEAEPNDTFAAHHALMLPTTVQGSAESGDVGDTAVRGDGIEDIFRIDLTAPDSLRLELTTNTAGQNVDVYALDEDLRVLNETGQGTSSQSPDAVCLDLDPGAYYLLVTNADTTKSAPAQYTLDVESDPQTIAVTLGGGASTIEVDAGCQATVDVSILLHDNCCLDPATLDLQVVVSNPTANAAFGPFVQDSVQVLGPRDILVKGHVAVSDVRSCPAVLRVDASASDCTRHRVHTTVDGGSDAIDVLDTIPPMVSSSVATATLWPPTHDLVDVGFTASAVDNCDAQAAQTLGTSVWSDEAEISIGSGMHAPDAVHPNTALMLRAERQGLGDGRVYLMTTDATDACGNRAFACSAVGVPHDPAAANDTLASQMAAALQFCQANAGAAPPGFLPQGVSGSIGPKK
jgi:hypothetical protein